jgi:hypothetical protein
MISRRVCDPLDANKTPRLSWHRFIAGGVQPVLPNRVLAGAAPD